MTLRRGERQVTPNGSLTHTSDILRVFDLTAKYGPCAGISRLERWERANKWGLSPPEEVGVAKSSEAGRTDIFVVADLVPDQEDPPHAGGRGQRGSQGIDPLWLGVGKGRKRLEKGVRLFWVKKEEKAGDSPQAWPITPAPIYTTPVHSPQSVDIQDVAGRKAMPRYPVHPRKKWQVVVDL